MAELLTPHEATIAQFAPGAEAGEHGPEEPYRGPSAAWYRGESLTQALVRGIIDGQG